jgi:Domain of unknown function (DUF4387)
MAALGDVAAAVKSANAGASWITFDAVFADEASYRLVAASGVLNPDVFAELYGVNASEVRVYNCDPVLTIKATMPRLTSSGGPEETDFDGVQQFIPLLSVEVPCPSVTD